MIDGDTSEFGYINSFIKYCNTTTKYCCSRVIFVCFYKDARGLDEHRSPNPCRRICYKHLDALGDGGRSENLKGASTC